MTHKTATSEPDSSALEADPATVIRRAAAEQLSAQLGVGTALIAQCDGWARSGKRDRVESAAVAARLMLASAGVAKTLILAALGETRHRTITETPSPVDREREARRTVLQDRLKRTETQQKVWGRLNEIVENSIRARMGETGVEDRIARVLRDNEKTLERTKRDIAEDD